MSQQFIQRIANWLANELITKRLANSSAFINLAHKTHTQVQKIQKIAEEAGATAGRQAAAQRSTVFDKQMKGRRP